MSIIQLLIQTIIHCVILSITFESVGVCWIYDGVAVDIREFVNEQPSIKGIQLSHLEWKDFMTYIGLIDYIVRNGPTI